MSELKNELQCAHRSTSVLNDESLEPLYTVADFPVYMGCVDTPRAEDIVANMVWGIDSLGMIQLMELLPLDVLYLAQHNDGVGKVWREHYEAFAAFLLKYGAPGEILEVGGAHDIIATHYLKTKPEDHWTIIEPNPSHTDHPNIEIIKDWFTAEFRSKRPPTTIVHSHVLEHMYQPFDFIRQIWGIMPEDGRCVFSFPNMVPMLEQKFTNCLNFEHTAFLAEPFVDAMLHRIGFEPIAKEYFGNPHSIFYALQKTAPDSSIQIPNMYEQFKKMFMDFIDFHKKEVAVLNTKIESHNGPIYLFGAHIFSQYLMQFGLLSDRIISVLDNSTLKQGKRLYATNLRVESPHVLVSTQNAAVVLKAGIYNEEIKKDIIENINPHVVFW